MYEPDPGDIVQIQGMVAHTHLNGRIGRALGKREDGGYLIDLGEGEIVPVLPANLTDASGKTLVGGPALPSAVRMDPLQSGGRGATYPGSVTAAGGYLSTATASPQRQSHGTFGHSVHQARVDNANATSSVRLPAEEVHRQYSHNLSQSRGYYPQSVAQSTAPGSVPLPQHRTPLHHSYQQPQQHYAQHQPLPLPPVPAPVPAAHMGATVYRPGSPVGRAPVLAGDPSRSIFQGTASPRAGQGVRRGSADDSVTERESELLRHLGRLAEDNQRLRVELGTKNGLGGQHNYHTAYGAGAAGGAGGASGLPAAASVVGSAEFGVFGGSTSAKAQVSPSRRPPLQLQQQQHLQLPQQQQPPQQQQQHIQPQFMSVLEADFNNPRYALRR